MNSINQSEKNAADSLAISMAMRIRRYGAEHIAQYGRSRATLDATGCHHWASIHPVLPQRTPWSSISAETIELWHCESLFKASVQKARNGPSNHVIKATSCVERSNATIKAEEHS